MRFDDRLQTIKAMSVSGAAARWSQLVDLMAQRTVGLDVFDQADLAEIDSLSADVPDDRKLSVATAIGPRTRSPAIVGLFARERARIAAPVLLGAALTDDQWVALIPQLSPEARSLLRQRRGLPEGAQQALQRYGAADFALPDQSAVDDDILELETAQVLADAAPETAAPETMDVGISKISDLVARIDRWQRQRDEAKGSVPPLPVVPAEHDVAQHATDTASEFRFEADEAAIVNWVEGVASAALIGLDLAELAPPTGYGADGQITGPVAKRAAITNGRLSLDPDGAAGGLWRVSAIPMFAASDGRFQGYRGIAKRLGEPTPVSSPDQSVAAVPDDFGRQVAHELRAPLTAISGFAEMISGQVLGPAAAPYRTHAKGIVQDASRLLGMVDALDLASRSHEAGQQEEGVASEDCLSVLADHARQQALPLVIEADAALPHLAADKVAVGRCLARLADTMADWASAYDPVALDVKQDGAMVGFAFNRPDALQGIPEAVLRSADEQDGKGEDTAAMMALSFTLRMLGMAAERFGGRFVIADRFTLLVPAVAASGEALKESL